MKENLYDAKKYKEFAMNHTGSGELKVQVSGANQAFPLEGVIIEVNKEINGEDVTFFKGQTDNSGIIDDIILPTVRAKDDIESQEDIYFTDYKIVATYPRVDGKKEYIVSIYDGLKVIQPIRISTINLMNGMNKYE